MTGNVFLTPRLEKDFVQVERAAKFLDGKFKIGGFSFGWDPLLNFIPFAGQIITFLMSLLLVIVMYRNGASSKVVVKMLYNVVFDAFFGSIPLLGNVFDFFNKANKKNVALLREHYFEDKHKGSAKGLLIGAFAALLILMIGFFYGMTLFSFYLLDSVSSIF